MELRRAGHATTYVSRKKKGFRRALRKKADLYVAAGGDGTIRDLALALNRSAAPIAIIPLGTANNIAQSFGVPPSTRRAIQSWRKSAPRPLDMAVARGPWRKVEVVESVGCGLFSRAVAVRRREEEEAESEGEKDSHNKSSNPSARLKQDLDLLAKILGASRPQSYRIWLDGKEHSGDYLLVEVMNISCVGPNLLLAPDADPGDGRLDVVLLPERERRRFSAYLKARRAGDEPRPRWRVRRASEIRIEAAIDWVHLDDNVWPEVEDAGSAAPRKIRIDISIQPGARTVLLPRPLPGQIQRTDGSVGVAGRGIRIDHEEGQVGWPAGG